LAARFGPRAAGPLGIALIAAATSFACAARPACDGLRCAVACPQGASRDPAGRCACSPSDRVVLGACVTPAVADAYCGPAAQPVADGCVFRACAAEERLDAVTGACVPRSMIAPARAPCGDGVAAISSQGHMICLGGPESPAAAAVCPRGTRRVEQAGHPECARPPRCPAGSLADGASCRAMVSRGMHEGTPRVDVGAWTRATLGVDGGRGSDDLCRPLWLRPDLFGVSSEPRGAVALRILLTVPDQDLTRVHARTVVEAGADEGAHPLSSEAETVAAASTATLVEALRNLGGEASAAIVDLRVRCPF
jgi:hypothetical protein